MSLSSCVECYDCPCTCGHNYRNWSNDNIYSQIVMLIKVLTINNKISLQPIIDSIIKESNIRGIH